jgi:hypothetical protein
MRNLLNKTISFAWTALLLVFFEGLFYLVSGGMIGGYSYANANGQQVTLVFVNLVLFLSFYAVMIFMRTLHRGDLLKGFPSLLLDLGTLMFIFYNPLSPLCHVVAVASTLILFLKASEETDVSCDQKSDGCLLSVVLAYTSFVWFLNAYTIFYTVDIPYWVIIIALAMITGAPMLAEFKKPAASSSHRLISVILYVIILTEFFLFSFFWPVESILIKSFLLLLAYYLYWGAVTKYLEGRFVVKDLLPYFGVFILATIVVFALVIIKGM